MSVFQKYRNNRCRTPTPSLFLPPNRPWSRGLLSPSISIDYVSVGTDNFETLRSPSGNSWHFWNLDLSFLPPENLPSRLTYQVLCWYPPNWIFGEFSSNFHERPKHVEISKHKMSKKSLVEWKFSKRVKFAENSTWDWKKDQSQNQSEQVSGPAQTLDHSAGSWLRRVCLSRNWWNPSFCVVFCAGWTDSHRPYINQ